MRHSLEHSMQWSMAGGMGRVEHNVQRTTVKDAQCRTQRRRNRQRASLGDPRACSARAARPQHRRQPAMELASFLLSRLHAM